ncbi:MAG: phage tail protein I [Betaproteobacteria bacterium]|nr:phage tail protein I [Betaproteobacteria bacterium]
MNSRPHLLPSASTALETAAVQALAAAHDYPIPLRDLWNPATCPAEVLPFLAWARSVDWWNEDWPVAAKRAAVAAAFEVHRKKGTIGALRRVVEPLGYLIDVIEWWQSGEPRGTFRLRIGVLDTGITDEMYAEIERLIDDAKPLTRHLVGLAISLETQGAVKLACGTYLGDELTVYPYLPSEIVIEGFALSGGALHTIDTMTITPS